MKELQDRYKAISMITKIKNGSNHKHGEWVSTINDYLPSFYLGDKDLDLNSLTGEKIEIAVKNEISEILSYEKSLSTKELFFSGYDLKNIKNNELIVYLTPSFKNEEPSKIVFSIYKTSRKKVIEKLSEKLKNRNYKEKNSLYWKFRSYVKEKSKSLIKKYKEKNNTQILLDNQEVKISWKRHIFKYWDIPIATKEDSSTIIYFEYLGKKSKYVKLPIKLTGKKKKDKKKRKPRNDIPKPPPNLAGIFKALLIGILGWLASQFKSPDKDKKYQEEGLKDIICNTTDEVISLIKNNLLNSKSEDEIVYEIKKHLDIGKKLIQVKNITLQTLAESWDIKLKEIIVQIVKEVKPSFIEIFQQEKENLSKLTSFDLYTEQFAEILNNNEEFKTLIAKLESESKSLLNKNNEKKIDELNIDCVGEFSSTFESELAVKWKKIIHEQTKENKPDFLKEINNAKENGSLVSIVKNIKTNIFLDLKESFLDKIEETFKNNVLENVENQKEKIFPNLKCLEEKTAEIQDENIKKIIKVFKNQIKQYSLRVAEEAISEYWNSKIMEKLTSEIDNSLEIDYQSWIEEAQKLIIIQLGQPEFLKGINSLLINSFEDNIYWEIYNRFLEDHIIKITDQKIIERLKIAIENNENNSYVFIGEDVNIFEKEVKKNYYIIDLERNFVIYENNKKFASEALIKKYVEIFQFSLSNTYILRNWYFINNKNNTNIEIKLKNVVENINKILEIENEIYKINFNAIKIVKHEINKDNFLIINIENKNFTNFLIKVLFELF